MPDAYTLSPFSNVRTPVPAKCAYSHVVVTQDILINDAPHAGVLTHRCSLNAKHGDSCVCLCGFRWKGYTL